MSLTLTRVVEVTEQVDIWDAIMDPEQLDELTGDIAKQHELKRLYANRDELRYQCDRLIALFPEKEDRFKRELAEQIGWLEEQIRRLLPWMQFD